MATITITIPEELYARIERASRAATADVDATIVQALAHAFAAETGLVTPRVFASAEEERAAFREAMGDRLVDPRNWDDLLDELGGPMTTDEIEQLRSELSRLDPSFSEALVQMRDDERS